MRIVAVSCLALVCFAVPVRADSWASPAPMEAVSQDGRWRVQITPGHRWSESTCTLLQRVYVRGKPDWKTVTQTVQPHPIAVRCMNDGSFLLFERHGSVGGGLRAAIQVITKSGAVRWTKQPAQWFDPKTWAAMPSTASSTWWYEGIWIDEKSSVLAVITVEGKNGRGLLAVRLKDGERVAAEDRMLLRGMRVGTEEERVLAIESARLMKTEGAEREARTLYDRKDLTPLVRLHLALVIAASHEPAAKLISTTARTSKDPDLRKLAIRHLGLAEKKASTQYLLEVLRGGKNDAWYETIRALAEQGPGVIEPVSKILLDAKLPLNARGGAASVLGFLRAKARPALPALLQAALTARDGTANSAINSLRRIVEGQELRALYVALLRVPTGDDDLVALLVTGEPSRDAVVDLERKLAQMPANHGDRAWYVEALDACKQAPKLDKKALQWATALVAKAREVGR